MTEELKDTLRLIIDRIGNNYRVFIPLCDFSWYNHRNGQLTQLYKEGLVTKPVFQDNGVLIAPTKKGRNWVNKMINETDNHLQIHDKPSIFVSYNHRSITIVERLVDEICPYADVHWDQNVGPWESFKSFMDTIRKQDFAVLIISDAYLKSKACQYEVIKLMKTDNWDKKAMYIVENSARTIFDVLGRTGYIDYWDKKEQELQKELNKHCIEAVRDMADEIQAIKEIKAYIGDFMKKVSDANNPEVPDAIHAITDRMKISAGRNRRVDVECVILTLLRSEEMSTTELSIALNRAESTVRNYLHRMVANGTIVKKGNGRSCTYSAR